MKKTLAIYIIGLLVFMCTDISFSLEDEVEAEIFKRHKQWIEKVLLSNGQTKKTEEGYYLGGVERIKEEITLPEEENGAVIKAKNDLCDRLDIKYNKIKEFRWELISTDSVESYRIDTLIIGLVYEKQTYLYVGYQHYDGWTEDWADARFTGEIIPTEYDEKGNLILGPGDLAKRYEDYIMGIGIIEPPEPPEEIEFIVSGPLERKIIEDQIESQAKDPFFYPQMADEPEPLPMPKE